MSDGGVEWETTLWAGVRALGLDLLVGPHPNSHLWS